MTDNGQTTVVVVQTCGSDTVNSFDYSKLKDRSYKGEDYNCDATLVKGPLQQRKCTDCLFLFVWFAFLIAMMIMIIVGYTDGQADVMLAPISQYKQICGFGDYETYPVLFVPNLDKAIHPVQNFFEYGYCADECPLSNDGAVTCATDPTGQCQEVYETSQVLNYCIPTASSIAAVTTATYTNNFATSNFFISMYETRFVLLTCIFISLVLALIYIKLMDWFAVPIAWLTIAVIEIALCVMGYLTYAYAQDVIETNNGRNSHSAWLLTGASFLWILAGLYYVIMFCNWKSLKVSIAIIETAADWFADTKRIAFVPLIYFCVWCCVFVFWLWGLCGVASITDSEITVSSVQFQTKDVNRSSGTNWMIAGMVLGMIWVSAFIIACNEFAVICAAATWYFSRKDIEDSDGIPGDADVMKGFWWTYRYQMGTMAFGSFLLTLIWLVRSILEYLGEKAHQATAGNKCVECILCCLRCVLDCFDRFLRYLNTNAFIYCAISSESFCPSALHSFLLILKNSAKFAFVEGIASSFMFLAKTFIAVLTTLIGYSILPAMTAPINVDPTMPCIFIFAFAYLVACGFISIFEVSATTILQCYLFDLDISKHHGLDLKHVPQSLLKFLDVHKEHAPQVVVVDEKQNLLQ